MVAVAVVVTGSPFERRGGGTLRSSVGPVTAIAFRPEALPPTGGCEAWRDLKYYFPWAIMSVFVGISCEQRPPHRWSQISILLKAANIRPQLEVCVDHHIAYYLRRGGFPYV